MGIITLTSDIGLQDYMVGAVKGLLHQACPEHSVIDISHDIPPFNFPQAAYLCRSAIPWFPPDTCHFILVNLFDRNAPFLLCRHGGQYFICADNGLITMILGQKPEEAVKLDFDRQGIDMMGIIKGFSETVLAMSYGTPLGEIGLPVDEITERNPLLPIVHEDFIEGQVIYIDRFENVIVNITRSQFESCRKGRSFKIFVMRDDFINHLSAGYSDVPEGRKLALFNSAGYLEIAINKGNAAGLFGLQSYSREQPSPGINENLLQRHLFYQTIRIYFE